MTNPALTADCSSCFGLCCTALGFTRADGFGHDKPVGVPCQFLSAAFRCTIHPRLDTLGYEGCSDFDCFGAGQLASAQFAAQNWQHDPAIATKLHVRFADLLQIQEIRAALEDAQNMPMSKSRERERLGLLDALEQQARSQVNDCSQTVVSLGRAFVNALKSDA